ncbi:hypothetical protein [Thermophilibacter mediterraneus]|uniref:hypothetical protein n=1 Tax=Thermophilibacter mediterraneus TaxID=1871031 RepID=UPI0023563BCC|nr:hypothetical protein [Thermophilibacter mediterraneus]
MLRLNENHLGARVTSDEVSRASGSHSDVLARCQAGEGRHAGSLGWLHVDDWASDERLDRIEELAGRLREAADTFVLIGVGGSNNAARAALCALGARDGSLDGTHRVVYAGNTLSAFELRRVLEDLEGRNVVIDCVAKNFETLEPGSSFRLLRQWLVGRYGPEGAARRIVCCGTPGSHLDDLCHEHGYEFTTFPEPVGGRYTALTEVHLLPMAFAGVDVRALVAGARSEEALLRDRAADPADNPAWRYALVRRLAWDAGLRVELLSFFEPRFRWFSKWYEQLFGESEGKDGLGLFPASAEYSEELHSLGQYVQDGTHQLMETFLDVMEPGPLDSLVLGGSDIDDRFGYLDGCDFWEINKASFTASRAAHARTLPCPTIELDRVDEEHLGRIFYFFMFSCYLSAELLGVNPFDQPGVEAYKQLMFRTLGR